MTRKTVALVFVFLLSCTESTQMGAGTDSSAQGDSLSDGETGGLGTDTGSSSTQAVTSLGEVNGFATDDGVVAFLGIPYAKPPVGELRFAPPVPLDSWENPLEAMKFGPACPQPEIEPDPGMNWERAEDCLTLNVWTPAVDDKERPVMFWIHGGGWIWESSGDLIYNGGRMAARGDVVVVSVEYRLGAFGFSHFEDEPGSGNAGLLDQVLALRWVRDHIRAFGGDPDNVTIWGESAGSYSVCSIMGMPDAAGLFHKGIAQSGGTAMTRLPDYAKKATQLLLDFAGAKTLEELRELSWQEVLAAQEKVMETSLLPESIYGPVIDGVVFSEPPLSAIAKGESSDIPMILGSTRDEARWWMVEIPVLRTPLATPLAMMTAFPYYRRSVPSDKAIWDAIFVYRKAYPDQALTPNLLSLAIGTDVVLRIPTLRHAEAQVAHQPQNVFVFRFDWAPPSPGYPDLDLGAMHGAELGFTMGYPEGWPELYGDSGLPQGLRDQIMDAWIAFAKTGDPNHENLSEWKPYDLEERPTMLLNAEEHKATSQIENDPDGVTRAFWDGVPFDGVRPALRPEDLSKANLLFP